MNERLKKVLYGGLYPCSPGSDKDKEQTRRVRDAMELMEDEATRRIERREKTEGKLTTFREKAVEKGGGK